MEEILTRLKQFSLRIRRLAAKSDFRMLLLSGFAPFRVINIAKVTFELCQNLFHPVLSLLLSLHRKIGPLHREASLFQAVVARLIDDFLNDGGRTVL